MTNDEMAEMIAERNGNQRYCKNCDDCCQPYNSTDDCFKSAMKAMQWKDEQIDTIMLTTEGCLRSFFESQGNTQESIDNFIDALKTQINENLNKL